MIHMLKNALMALIGFFWLGCGCCYGVGGGNLLLVGGGEKPREVMELFVKLAGGSDQKIVILPMATQDTNDTGRYYRKLLNDLGARKVRVLDISSKDEARREENVEVIRTAKGIWFSGGDQSRITERILGTPAHEALREMLANGGVVGGTSAGTACQSDPMLNGEGDPGALQKGSTELVRGLGLFHGVIVDQHFIRRQRHNRLLAAILEHPDKLGVGIDEDTAIWVKPDQSFEVLGDSVVEIIDARSAAIRFHGKQLTATGLQMTILAAGDTFSMPAPLSRIRKVVPEAGFGKQDRKKIP